jgi:hypothetical protein
VSERIRQTVKTLKLIAGDLHISDDAIERYCFGQITNTADLYLFEEYLLSCPACAGRAQAVGGYVDAMRTALAETNSVKTRAVAQL